MVPPEVHRLAESKLTTEALVRAEAERLDRRMNRNRHVELFGRRPEAIVEGVRLCLPRPGKRRDESALCARAHGALELSRGFLWLSERDVGDRNQAAAGLGAEIHDPAVVGAAIGGGKLGILDLRLPENADRRIQERLAEPLLVEADEALFRVHRPERGPAEVRTLRCRRDVLRSHTAQRAGKTRRHVPRRLPIPLEVFQSVRTGADSDRAVAKSRLEVLRPKVRRLQYVAVAVDRSADVDARIVLPFHRGPPLRLRRLPVRAARLAHSVAAVPRAGGLATRTSRDLEYCQCSFVVRPALRAKSLQ